MVSGKGGVVLSEGGREGDRWWQGMCMSSYSREKVMSGKGEVVVRIQALPNLLSFLL